MTTCDCFLPVDPPASGLDWWFPQKDDEPGPEVTVVARHGEDPELRRAVREPNGSGWREQGAMVDFYDKLTPPMPWSRVGDCWANCHHPVVPVHGVQGRWVAR